MNDDSLLRELRAEIHQLGPSSPSRRYLDMSLLSSPKTKEA